MFKILFFAIIFLVNDFVFALTLTTEDKIKSCMAGIYFKQETIHNKTKKYTKNLSDFDFTNLLDCKGLEIEIKEASEKSFIVVVKDKRQSWKIDSTKTMTKLI